MVVIGKIFKDNIWKQVMFPKHLIFENFEYQNINWSWNEEHNVLIDRTHGIIMRHKKDDFLKLLSSDVHLMVYNNLCSTMTFLTDTIELWNTWYSQKEFEWLNI